MWIPLSKNDIQGFQQQILSFFESEAYTCQRFEPTIQGHTTSGINGYLLQKQGSSLFLGITDPQVRGGSFSEENLKYLSAFLAEVSSDQRRSPLIFCFSSGGVRVTHPRTIYNPIWGMLPIFFQIKKQRPYFSLAHEKCLGAAALFFGQGHFRIATSPDTLINLTGPGVIERFFGKSENFSQYASANFQNERHFLIQEVAHSLGASLRRITGIIESSSSDQDEAGERGQIVLNHRGDHQFLVKTERFEQLLNLLADQAFELFSNSAPAVRTFLCRKQGKTFGLFINPLDHPMNTLSHLAIDKYFEALEIFESLQLPILSVIDSPGGDPTQKSSDQNMILKTLRLVEKLIDYPHAKIGLVAGRCFGGSGVLSLPIVHGSKGLYAIRGSKIGVMADEIVTASVKMSVKNSAEWQNTLKLHLPDLKDMQDAGIITQVLDFNECPALIEKLFSQ